MDRYTKTFEVIWADMDPNRHMRHTAYNDYAAQTRVAMFQEFGLSMENISKMGLGPILFREETTFIREINLSEEITVSCQVQNMRKDGSRWIIQHNIYNKANKKAAEIIVEGAWLNINTRKLVTPPRELLDLLHKLPRTKDFRWMPEKTEEQTSEEE